MYNRKNIADGNPLKDQIEALLKLCEKKDKESGTEDSYFEDPIEEEVMTKWEEENGVKIPESYKDWLRFSKNCKIMNHAGFFREPSEFHSKYVPEDLVVIGEIVGDGERVCFSKKTGKIVLLYDFEEEEKNSFADVIQEIIDFKSDGPGLSDSRLEEILAMLKAEREMEEKK